MAKKEKADAAAPAKGGGAMSTIVALVILTGLGVGAGGLFGIQAAQKIATQPSAAEPAKDAHAAKPAAAKANDHGSSKEHGKEAGKEAAQGPHLVPLPNIVTNLAAPEKIWIRLEASAIIDDADPAKLASVLAEDILAYLRTVKLDQIQGGSGYQYLREDLNERVRLRGQGKVRDFILQSFILE